MFPLKNIPVLEEPPEKWRETADAIHFSVTSDGTTGSRWAERLRKISGMAISILLSNEFKPTSGITTNVVVLKGSFFPASKRITPIIVAEGKKRGLKQPNAEVACLIRKRFSDTELKSMGLWSIVVMHTPIKDLMGQPSLLSASRHNGAELLSACYENRSIPWSQFNGFAFVTSEE